MISIWTEEGREPFLLRVDGRIAGFVLVNRDTRTGAERSISEFFVMRRYRRRGVGRDVAKRVFDRLPGSWEIEILANHDDALAFWNAVVSEYTGGSYEQVQQANRIFLLFSNARPAFT